MLNFTQRLYFKIIALAVAGTLFCESAVYGTDLSTRKHLRVPVSGIVERIKDIEGRNDIFVSSDEKTLPELSEGYVRKNKLSFVMIKPDGIAERAVILQMLKDAGIEIVYEGKARVLAREEVEELYAEHKGKHFFEGLIEYITSGGVIPIIVRSKGEDAIADVEEIVGHTKGEDDEGTVDNNTIRGRLMTDEDRSSQPIRNRIHASDNVKSVVKEANIVIDRRDKDAHIKALNLPEDEAEYFRSIYRKYQEGVEPLVIGENFIPTALMSEEERVQKLGVVYYKDLKEEDSDGRYSKETEDIIIIYSPLGAGTGARVRRWAYLNKRAQEEPEIQNRERDASGNVKLGSKGTDLAFDVDGRKLSLAEIKLLRIIKDKASYHKGIYQPIVSPDSKPHYEALLKKYEEGIEVGDIERFCAKSLPTINPDTGRLQDTKKASGGHGQIGMMFLLEVLRWQEPQDRKTHIRAIFNGDGLNNMPNRRITGWMKKQNIPIIMLTTPRTAIDYQGGLIGTEILPDGKEFPQILELAQAIEFQKELFFNIGLREGEKGEQDFNTNNLLINYSVLSPIFKELAEIIGIEKLTEIITPTLIPNPKHTENGARFIQLDSAIASAILNLNAFFETTDDPRIREILSKRGLTRLLQILRVSESDRTEFFTPGKTAFDFLVQMQSDYYWLNTETWMLEETGQGQTPPLVNLTGFDKNDKYYDEVQNLIDSFGRASTRELRSLRIKGRVGIKDAVLIGDVELINNTGDFVDLDSEENKKKLQALDASLVQEDRLYFKDVKIVIDGEDIIICPVPIVVTIDGPAGVGKTTVGIDIADRLGIGFFSYGRMYRLASWFAMQKGVMLKDRMTEHEISELVCVLEEMDIEKFEIKKIGKQYRYFYDSKDITGELDSHKIINNTPFIAELPQIRSIILKHAQIMVKRIKDIQRGVVVEGRVAGIEVVPIAEVKIFLTADLEERATRRAKELVKKTGLSKTYLSLFGKEIPHGKETSEIWQEIIKEVGKDIEERDETDSKREYMPLRPAHDALIIDTTNLTKIEVVKGVLVKASEILKKGVPEKRAGPLANTPITVDIVGFSSPMQPQLSVSCAPYTLSGNLKAHSKYKVNVSTYDMYADHTLSIDSIVESIIEDRPDVLGLAIVPGTLLYAKELWDKLNERIPADQKPLFVLGNAVPTYLPEILLREYFPGAIVVQGEGELPLIELVEYVHGERKLGDVHNLVYLRDGQIVLTETIEADLEKFASPDMDEVVRLAKKGAKVFIEASRGCPWGHCLFCSRRHLPGQKRWRPRPVEKVLEQVKILVENDIKSFDFADEEFFGPGIDGIRRAEDIAKGIIDICEKSGKNIGFSISCRVDSIWNEEDEDYLRKERVRALGLLKRAGLRKVFLGVESGSPSQLKRYNKGLTIKESEKAISIIRDDLGIGLDLGFIMFDPEVTLDEIGENIRFIERNNLLEHISWFLNVMRIQEGSPFAIKYRNHPEIDLSSRPDPNTLQYKYTFKEKDVAHLLDITEYSFNDSAKLYYILKSIFRAGIDDMAQEEFDIYMKYRVLLMKLYMQSFKGFLDIERESTLRAVLAQIRIAEDMVKDLRNLEIIKSQLRDEVISIAQDFIKADTEKIADAILHTEIEGITEIIQPGMPTDDVSTVNDAVFVLKPGGTFNKAFISDIVRRITGRGYTIEGIRIFDGEEIEREDIFRKQHSYAFEVAREGEALFSKEDYERMYEIYDTPEFEQHFGVSFKEIKIIPAYDLIEKYRLSEEDVARLWVEGYQEKLFQNGDCRGINKIGVRKYVLIVSDPRVENGRPFLLVNGVCIQMKELAEIRGEKTIVFLLRGIQGKSDTWKKMREEFLGDRMPSDSPIGSIRNDAYAGRMNVTEEVPFWKNIAHLSSGPLEALLEESLWFNLPIEQTAFGRHLLNNGYTEEEIRYFLTEPDVNINGIKKPLFDWIEKMDTDEAFSFIHKVFPPFYNEKAMPTMAFGEYLRYKELHNQGALSIATNTVSAERIKNTSVEVKECPKLSSDENRYCAGVGNSLIREGKLAQVLLAGGTAGRWFGYDVPEHLRIRFLAEPYELSGRKRSFAELKIANNLWAAREANGRIPIWIMTSELNDKTIRDFLREHNYFGLSADDAHFYIQGSIPRMNPTRVDLKAGFSQESEEWIDARIAENNGKGEIFRFKDGSISKKPVGHFDAIASLFLSRELLNMIDQGIEYINFSDATNLGTIIDPTLLGMLAMSDKDVLHILAKKNRIFNIKIRGLEKEQLVVIREGEIVYSSLPENLVPVIEGDKIVRIVDKATDKEIAAEIKGKLEKGGTLVDLDGEPQILEGFRFPMDYDQGTIPYFSTAHQIVKTEALLRLFGLSVDEYRNASMEQLLEKVSEVGDRLDTYLEAKKVLDDDLGSIRIAVQFSRLSGDLTSILPTEYVLIDRDGRYTLCAFIPFKGQEDIEINREMVFNTLSDRVILTNEGNLIGKLFLDSNATKQVKEGIRARRDGDYLVFYKVKKDEKGDQGEQILYTKDGKEAKVKLTGEPKEVSGQLIQVIEDNENIRGFADTGDIQYLSKSLLDEEIPRYHEKWESYYADPEHAKELPKGVNAHTFLRGCGKDVRKIVKEALSNEKLSPNCTADQLIAHLEENLSPQRYKLAEAEIALIRYNAKEETDERYKKGIGLIYGEQDKEFGPQANERFTTWMMLSRFGQGHLLDGWDGLSPEEKGTLLLDIEKVDWGEVAKLYQTLVKEGKRPVLDTKGFIQVEAIIERRPDAAAKGEEILKWGAKENKAKFAGIVVAGGTGSGLKYEHSKGLFLATPLSDKTLYLSLIHKMQAAAKAYGHEKMYPFVFMVSEQTERETIEYIKGLEEWKDIKDRVIFVRQKDLPGLIRKPGDAEDGKAFLKSKDRLNLGGAGHGDAFDYVLDPDIHTKGKIWSEQKGDFVEAEVVEWIERFGVEYVQYMNVDNLLIPLADKYFVGEHVLSRTKQTIEELEKREHRAHISLGMVRKTLWDEKRQTFLDRLGNVIVVNGRKESIDYGDATDEINACPWGDPSIRLVTIRSLAGSIPIEYSVAKKTDKDQYGNSVDIYKFERSSGNKKRYGIEMGYESEDIFAPIKKRDEDAETETPSTAKKLQSEYWKKLIRRAFPEIEIHNSVVIELPWEADYMSPRKLRKRLIAISFPLSIGENVGVLVQYSFSKVTIIIDSHEEILEYLDENEVVVNIDPHGDYKEGLKLDDNNWGRLGEKQGKILGLFKVWWHKEGGTLDEHHKALHISLFKQGREIELISIDALRKKIERFGVKAIVLSIDEDIFSLIQEDGVVWHYDGEQLIERVKIIARFLDELNLNIKKIIISRSYKYTKGTKEYSDKAEGLLIKAVDMAKESRGRSACSKAEVKLWVVHPAGLHGWPSGKIEKAVRESDSEVMLHYRSQIVDARNSIDILRLDVTKDNKIELLAVGPDASKVLEKICEISDEEGRYFYRSPDALSLEVVSDSMVSEMMTVFKDKNKPIEKRVEALVFVTKTKSSKDFLFEVLDDTREVAKVLEYAVALLDKLAQQSSRDIPEIIDRLEELRSNIAKYKNLNTNAQIELLRKIYNQIGMLEFQAKQADPPVRNRSIEAYL